MTDLVLLIKDYLGVGAGGGAAGFAWWATNRNQEDIKMLHAKSEHFDKALDDHKWYAANNYAKSSDVERLAVRLETKLDKIFDKLDSKADK